MNKVFAWVVLLSLLLGSCACENGIPGTYKPQKPENKEESSRQPGGKSRKVPEMGSFQVIGVRVEELSGLCLNRDSTALWAVGDEGALFKLSITGNSTPVMSTRLDLEAVTIDPVSGDLFLAVEGDQMVCRVAAPGYDKIDTLFHIQEALERDFDNNGLEGISFYKDSLLFVGSQEDALLWTCRLDGTIVSRISLCGETSLIEEIAGLCYDPVKKWLWVTDSDACKLFVFSADNFDLIASYDVPFIENAESICVDRARKCVWVGSDEDSPKLYKINFTF